MEFLKALTPQSCQCPSGCRTKIRRIGHYQRKSDGVVVQRYQCRTCARSFSDATFDPCFRQHKRELNALIFGLICSSVSQRRIAFLNQTTRDTVARKIRHMAKWGREYFERIKSSYGPIR